MTVGVWIGAFTVAPAAEARAAARDIEALGYDTLWYKLFIWTLSAVLCGVAGALYVPQVGIINQSEMSPAASIEIAIWTAVGGRATLIGPIVGGVLAAVAYDLIARPVREVPAEAPQGAEGEIRGRRVRERT